MPWFAKAWKLTQGWNAKPMERSPFDWSENLASIHRPISGGLVSGPIRARGVFRGEAGRGRPAARLFCGLSGVPGSGAGSGWPSRAVAGADRIGAGQAAAAGGPLAAASRFSHSCSRCQPSGRCRVRWPRPCRAIRAATAIRSRRMVAARALAKGRLARAPAARRRLCAMAAIDKPRGVGGENT